MSVSENFDRKFNKCMRGYNPEEVDSAVDALLRYCDELEDANREFEVANNDLIDEKNALAARVAELESIKNSLEEKNAEISKNLAKIEDVYNGYREKFGEARDLVTGAKTSASEIVARAKARAELISEEAEKKRADSLDALAKDIKARRDLIEQLDISYNVFSDKLIGELQDMLDRVSSFAVMPLIPDEVPKALEELKKDNDISQAKPIVIKPKEAAIDEAPLAETPNKEPEKEPIKEEITKPEEPEAPATEPATKKAEPKEPDISPLGPVWHESTGGESKAPSKMSQMKDSLDKINKIVSEKKSTPQI